MPLWANPFRELTRFDYMQDFCVDGMLHGRVVRPLAIGANLESVDESSVINTPGFVKVVREGKFLGVIATTEWDAIQAARELKATWSSWAGLPEQVQLWDYVRSSKVSKDEVTSNVGNSATALDNAVTPAPASVSTVTDTWAGLVAPRGTPPQIVTKLNGALRKIIDSPETQAQFKNIGFEGFSSTPEELGDFIKAQLALWGKMIKDANIQLD
jgi:hypothetical protein